MVNSVSSLDLSIALFCANIISPTNPVTSDRIYVLLIFNSLFHISWTKLTYFIWFQKIALRNFGLIHCIKVYTD